MVRGKQAMTINSDPTKIIEAAEQPTAVKIVYTNWRDEIAIRRIIPCANGLRFGSNEWHTKPQWLLRAIDRDKQEIREFAMSSIDSWSPDNDD
jgi:hypothetical protein